MNDRSKALQLARDLIDKKAQCWDDTAEIARALLQEAERCESMRAVVDAAREYAARNLRNGIALAAKLERLVREHDALAKDANEP